MPTKQRIPAPRTPAVMELERRTGQHFHDARDVMDEALRLIQERQ